MDPLLILFLSVASFFMAFLGTSVGGSGLVMTPLMIALGVPPANAVSAKKFANMGITSFSLPKYHRSGKVVWSIGLFLIAASVIGAYAAANIVVSLDAEVLETLIAFLVFGMLGLMVANSRLGLEQRARRMGRGSKALGFLAYMSSVFISGFVGGSGILLSFTLIAFFGLTFLESAATRKVAALFSGITAVIVYLFAGVLLLELAVPLFVSSALGGYAGTCYAIRKGDEWVRKLFILVVIGLGLKLLLF